jgi:hypothetical protein
MRALVICGNARRRLCHRVQDHAGFVEPELAVTEREHDFRAFAGELTFDDLAAAAHEAAVQRSEAMSRFERGIGANIPLSVTAATCNILGLSG